MEKFNTTEKVEELFRNVVNNDIMLLLKFHVNQILIFDTSKKI